MVCSFQAAVESSLILSEYCVTHTAVWKQLADQLCLLNTQFQVYISFKAIKLSFKFCVGLWIVTEWATHDWELRELREHQLRNAPWNADFSQSLYLTCLLLCTSSLIERVSGLIYRSGNSHPFFKMRCLMLVTPLWSVGWGSTHSHQGL